MLCEILHDKSGCEYVVTGVREYGRYTVKVNGVFWATVENGREFDEEVEEIKKSFFAYWQKEENML